jgi:hypothetical protein
MSELFQLNIEVIKQRWPEIARRIQAQDITQLDAVLVEGVQQTISVNGIQLSSRHDRIAEAQLFIDTLPTKLAPNVTVYGVGMGDVPSLLVEQGNIDSIKVGLFNLALFSLLIHYTDQTQWLSCEQLELVDLQTMQFLDSVYIAITPELRLVSDHNARLRDLIVFEQNREYANKQHHLDDPKLVARLETSLPFLQQDPDAADLSKDHNCDKALVIGSGPSLEQHYDYLIVQQGRPKWQRPLIIAVDTSVNALMSRDIVPDIIVSIEYNIVLKHFPDPLPKRAALVYFPRLSAEVLQAWPGPRFSAYSQSHFYDALNTSYPKLRLFTNGSVLHPAVALAVYLQATDITLLGCDFSYPFNKTHAFWADGSLGPSVAHNKKHWVLNGLGQRVATDINFIGYLRSLEHFIESQPQVKFYQSSLAGAAIQGANYRECKI